MYNEDLWTFNSINIIKNANNLVDIFMSSNNWRGNFILTFLFLYRILNTNENMEVHFCFIL